MKKTDRRTDRRYKGYANVCVVGKYTDPCMSYSSAFKFDTLTEARKYAKQYTNVYVYRVYFSGEETPVCYRQF